VHDQAHQWVADHAVAARTVLDLGGRDINGSVKSLFPMADVYTTLDILPGDGVDVVADAASWTPDRGYDVVVCCETFEHTKSWPDIVATAFEALLPAGRFIATMAGPGRGAHSALDEAPIRDWEHYENVNPDDLLAVLEAVGFVDIEVDYQPSPADTRCIARRP
jgi:hypothetical protein